MADGPCGPQFKEAFSCFVFSKEEPKGVDCIERFKGMQDCFRMYPDVYGGELQDEEEEGEAQGLGEGEGAVALAKDSAAGDQEIANSGSASTPVSTATESLIADERARKGEGSERAKAAAEDTKAKHTETIESESVIPKARHDGTDETQEQAVV
jgi:intermembrane space import and assembly protein 40